MTTETMTIHQALAELKMLDKRIENAINSAKFATANKASNTKIGGKNVMEYVTEANSALQSIKNMLARRSAIRHAVSLSNATTKVVINGTEYTVAEAIEMHKTGINVFRMLCNEMMTQYRDAQATALRQNNVLDAAADRYIEGLYGSKEKVQSADVLTVREAYIKSNTLEVVSVTNISDEIKALDEAASKFEAEVDAKLSVSNALTTITINY